MASTYTLKYKSICAGGEHVTLQLLKDGVVSNNLVFNKTDDPNPNITLEDVIRFLAAKALKTSSATTNAAKIAVIEAIVVTI